MTNTEKKQLILFRHGKSDWNEASLADIDRPLKPRGIRDALKMGEMLRERNIIPDLVLSSPANRAIHSSILLCRGLQANASLIQLKQNLYLASPNKILSLVYALDEHLQTVVLVGHNPGMSQLTAELATQPVFDLPTAGLACFAFEMEKWSQLSSLPPVRYFIEEPQKGSRNR